MLNACPLSADLRDYLGSAASPDVYKDGIVDAFRRRNWSGCATSLCLIEGRNAQ